MICTPALGRTRHATVWLVAMENSTGSPRIIAVVLEEVKACVPWLVSFWQAMMLSAVASSKANSSLFM